MWPLHVAWLLCSMAAQDRQTSQLVTEIQEHCLSKQDRAELLLVTQLQKWHSVTSPILYWSTQSKSVNRRDRDSVS